MKSQKVKSPLINKTINYENLPTLLNEKNKVKNKKINIKYIKPSINNNNNKNNNNKNKTEKKQSSNKKKYSIPKTSEKKPKINALSESPKSSKKTKNILPKTNNLHLKKQKGKIKEDFLTRQQRYSDQRKDNIKKLTREVFSQELSHPNKNKNLSKSKQGIKKKRDCFSAGSPHNASFISTLSTPKSMAEIENNISKMYEWETKRKEKLDLMRKKKLEENKKYSHIPTINKKSKNLATELKKKKNENENLFERLSNDDKLIKEKKKILEELYRPSFKPQLYFNKRNYYSKTQPSKKKDNRNNTHDNMNTKNVAENDKNIIYTIKVNRLVDRKEDSDDDDEKMNEEDIMRNLLRRTIIHNIGNKLRIKSAKKRKIKRYHS